MNPEERDAIEARHVRDTHYISGNWCAYCIDANLDEVPWPCDAARLLAALTEAEAEIVLLRTPSIANVETVYGRCNCPESGTSGSCPFHDASTVR